MPVDMATPSTAVTPAAEHSGEPTQASTHVVTGQLLVTEPPPEAEALKLPAAACYDGPTAITELREWAALLAESTMLPEVFRGSPSNIAVAALRAKALNIPFWVGLNEIFVTEDGSVGMTALLTNYLMTRAGCKVVVLRSDSTACYLSMTRPDRPGEVFSASWTMGDASTAGLVAPDDIWTRYPGDSLFARAVARMGRRHAPDITLGMAYTAGELAEAAASRAKAAQRAKGAVEVLVLPEAIKELLSTLEGLAKATDFAKALKECRVKHRFASKKGWMGVVCTDDGRTLEQVIFDVGDLLAVKAQGTQTEAASDTDDGDHAEELDCGCPVEEFLMTGAHTAKCNGERR